MSPLGVFGLKLDQRVKWWVEVVISGAEPIRGVSDVVPLILHLLLRDAPKLGPEFAS